MHELWVFGIVLCFQMQAYVSEKMPIKVSEIITIFCSDSYIESIVFVKYPIYTLYIWSLQKTLHNRLRNDSTKMVNSLEKVIIHFCIQHLLL